MQFIHRLRRRFQSRLAALRRLQASAQYIMRHVGISGRAECLATRSADGRAGVMLVIQTPKHVPVAAREEIQQYFRRKLTELGELRDEPFRLVIRDGDDLSLAHRARADSSSARIASVIAAANQRSDAEEPAEQLADLRMTVRQRTSERRQARVDSDYAPLTDIGSLPAN
ncbi:hypothetical protein [Ottowia testudinis]|uniref:Uncharacterized protein n=1 Tax=Ottowia testudinis TaxID=2816950 RepID=A0A975H4J9_9BURK|nr:hypothetical protein [Ottowia testudinis]QTD46939.1 hypothetical protein J1M35_08755 [Ottowia testudinis]